MVNISKADYTKAHIIFDFVWKLFNECEYYSSVLGVEKIKELLLKDSMQAFLISKKKHNIGVLTLVESESIYSNGKFVIVNELYLLPEYRTEKIIKLLLDTIKKIAIKKKWHRIELTIPDVFKDVMDYFTTGGYEEFGVRIKLII